MPVLKLIDGREICVSSTMEPVAVWIPARGYVRRKDVTEGSKYITMCQYAGYDSPLVPTHEFATLINPLKLN